MSTFRIVQIDHHPAALANNAKAKRTKVGEQGFNYFPHLTRTDAERYANDLNRMGDQFTYCYVEAV